MEQKVTDKVMKEVVTLLFSSLAGKTALPDLSQTMERTESTRETSEIEEDETLSSLSNEWS